MKFLHVVPGISDVANGMAVVANLLSKEQGDADVVDLNYDLDRINNEDVEEVWVHGMWLPREWMACRKVLKAGKRLVRMTHGSLSPIYLEDQSKGKKRLVSLIEKWLLRHADKVVVTCEAEAEWVRAYEPNVKSIVINNLKRFFRLPKEPVKSCHVHNLLYLGREHSLKGVECLKAAVANMQEVELRTFSRAQGPVKEKAWRWCDCLVLPTLSENFGLVIAEALERDKYVITTDGAPVWGDGNTYGNRLTYLRGYLDGSPAARVSMLKAAILSLTTSRESPLNPEP